MPGPELPAVAVESAVGDLVLFHHSLYHGVYNHGWGRRVIQGSFASFPVGTAHFASYARNGGLPSPGRSRLVEVSAAGEVAARALSAAECAALKAASEEAHEVCPGRVCH